MGKILRLMGATAEKELLPSLIAPGLAEQLETIQSQPVNVGRNVNISADGLALPRIAPTALKQLLTASSSPLAKLRGVRDTHVDRIHAILKKDGTAAQRAYLDARAQSRDDARRLADGATNIFDGIEDDSAISELRAAVGLFKLRVTPVVTVSIPFGGDNHSDVGLQEEIDQHVSGIEALATFAALLESEGMQDQVTLAILNVFGRTLLSDAAGGRDHWPKHSVSLLAGKGVRGSVVGGLRPDGEDFSSQGIDSATGAADDDGDIPYGETLASVGKTIWAAAGADRATIDANIHEGRVIDAALV